MTTAQIDFRHRLRLLASAGALLVSLGACAQVTPLEYTEVHEIQPGPGLLSGESGEFVLIGK